MIKLNSIKRENMIFTLNKYINPPQFKWTIKKPNGTVIITQKMSNIKPR